MAEEFENNDSLNVDTGNQTDETGEVTLTVDDYNRVANELQAEKAKNAKLYARIKESKKTAPLEKAQSPKESPELSQDLAKLKLAVNYGIKDPDAVEFLMNNGGEEALKNPFIKQTMDNMLAQKATEAAQVAEDSQKSDFERKVTIDQMKNMSIEELEKVLPRAH